MDKVTVPEGEKGNWAVRKFTITDHESRMSMFSYGSRAPSSGDYTKLTCGGTVVMSDTHAEMRDHYPAIRNANL